MIEPTSRLLNRITGVDVQPEKGVVGRDAFACDAGIHPDRVRKDARTGPESNRALARFMERADRPRRATRDERAALAEAGLSPSVRRGTRKEGRS